MSSVCVSVENGLVDWRMEESTITLAAWLSCCYSHLAACDTLEREEDEKTMSSAGGVVAERNDDTHR